MPAFVYHPDAAHHLCVFPALLGGVWRGWAGGDTHSPLPAGNTEGHQEITDDVIWHLTCSNGSISQSKGLNSFRAGYPSTTPSGEKEPVSSLGWDWLLQPSWQVLGVALKTSISVILITDCCAYNSKAHSLCFHIYTFNSKNHPSSIPLLRNSLPLTFLCIYLQSVFYAYRQEICWL